MSFSDLLITYTDASGVLSERTISPLEVIDGICIYAKCHMRNENRSFNVSRITAAVDISTGEVIDDVYAFLGIPHPPAHSQTTEAPFTSAEIKKRRQKERKEFFREYRYDVIRQFFVQKFFRLFDNRCFRCGSPDRLAMDHHLPTARGGHFVPGNLVPLCIGCNTRKSDHPPEVFYSAEELAQLQPLLAAQIDLFAFDFNWEKWSDDREGYLLSIGIDSSLVREVLHNEEHPLYVGKSCVITLGLSGPSPLERECHGKPVCSAE